MTSRLHRAIVVGGAVIAVAAGAATAAAQTAPRPAARRAAVDTVFGYQDFPRESAAWPAQYVADLFATVEVHRQWQVTFRPKAWRTRGEWAWLVDQVSVQTEFRKGSNWRIEAGRFPVPIGLGMMENRADLNAGLLWWHRPYYMPLPSLGADVPRVSLASAVYPTGVQVTTSTTRWDARTAILDLAPVQFWSGPERPSRRPNAILAGGVTPWQGFRVGAGVAAGPYAPATATRPALDYTMANVEVEYTFAYTRLSGEWIRDGFDTPDGRLVARGVTVQWQQTLTPRLFVHTRASAMDSPEASRAVPGTSALRTYRSLDTTAGYRMTPEVTVRVGHSAVWSWTTGEVAQQVGLSLMWARRWW